MVVQVVQIRAAEHVVMVALVWPVVVDVVPTIASQLAWEAMQ